jgi:hypothetical protein
VSKFWRSDEKHYIMNAFFHCPSPWTLLQHAEALLGYSLWPTVPTDMTGSDQQYRSDTIMLLYKPVVEALGDLICVQLSDRTEWSTQVLFKILYIVWINSSSSIICIVYGYMNTRSAVFSLFSLSFLLTYMAALPSLFDVLTGWHVMLGCPIGLFSLSFNSDTLLLS